MRPTDRTERKPGLSRTVESGTPLRDPLWTRDFVLLVVSNLALFISFQMLMPTLPVYVQRLGGSDAVIGLVTGVFTIASVAIRPVTGLALDRWGRRGLLLAGLALFILSVLGYDWALAVPLLLAARFIHGFGWGVSSTAYGTVATDVIPPSRLGEGMGYYGLAGTLAMAVAPALGLYIVGARGFSALFVTSAVLAVAALVLVVNLRYQAPTRAAEPDRSWPALFEPSAFGPGLVIFFVTMTYGTVVSFLALHAAKLGVANIGPFFAVYASAVFVTRPFAGTLADRHGYDLVVVPGLVLLMLGLAALGLGRSLPAILVAAIPYGVALGAVQPSLQALSVKGLPPARRGAANGTFYTSFDLGIAAGSVLGGVIANRLGYGLMYLLGVIPAGTGLLVYLRVGRRGRRRQAE